MSQPETPQQLRVKRTPLGGVTIVGFTTPYLQSEVEIDAVGTEILALVNRQDCGKLLLSFDGVRFVSSSMLAQLVKLHKRLAKSKGKLRVCSLTPGLREVVNASQLDKLFEVYDDEAAALVKF